MDPVGRRAGASVSNEEGEETRKVLDDAGAVGFLTLINQPRAADKGPPLKVSGSGISAHRARDAPSVSPRKGVLHQYADDLKTADSGAAPLRALKYTHDLVQAFFPNPRQTKVAKEADVVLRGLLQVPLPSKSGTMTGRRLPTKSSSTSSIAKTAVTAFVPVVEALEVLGSWQAIFFAFALVQEGPMDPAEIDKLRMAAQAFVELDANADVHAAALGLLQFLTYHEMDPFGLLIGHAVNPFLCALDWVGRDAVCQPSPTRLQWGSHPNSNAASANLVGAATSAPSSPVLSGPLFKRRQSATRESKRGMEVAVANGTGTGAADPKPGDINEVMAKIYEWADLKSDAELAEAVREYAAVLRHSLSTIKPGDLVLVCWRTASDRDHSRVYFGRFVCFIDTKTVGVYMDALENDTWQVPNHLVAALPRSLLNPINVSHSQMSSGDGSWRRLLATVVDARETATMAGFETVVTQQLDSYLSDTAATYELDYGDLKRRIAAREIGVSDLPQLKQVARLVADADQSGMQIWMVELRQVMEAHATKTMAAMNVRQVFLPHRRDMILMLAGASEHAEPLMHKAIAKVQALVESAMKSIQSLVDDVKSGRRKKALITWWLDQTRTQMMNLLIKLGYAENATSYDYINDPPLDYRGVQRNLQVLRHVLEDINEQRCAEQSSPLRPPTLTASAPVIGTTGVPAVSSLRGHEAALGATAAKDANNTGVWTVIEAIKAQVYPRIQEYVNDCVVILCDALRIPVASFSHDTCQKLYESRAATFGDGEKRALAALLDDIDYLMEMQRLESNPREKSMHIVPISGLCVGRVVRLESEMRTVVEVWGNKFGTGRRRTESFADEVEDDSSYSSSSAAVVIPDDFDMANMRQKALELVRNIKVEDRWYRMVCYKECWIGSEAVDYFVRAAGASSRKAATTLCANLQVLGLIEPVIAGMPFVDGWEFYRFPKQLLQDHVMDELLLP